MKIFISDPDSVSVFLTIRNLRNLQTHEVKIYYNLIDLLAAAQKSNPELIIIDEKLCKEIQMFEPFFPRLVIISTFFSEKNKQRFLNYGIKNLIIKPLTEKKLSALLVNLNINSQVDSQG